MWTCSFELALSVCILISCCFQRGLVANQAQEMDLSDRGILVETFYLHREYGFHLLITGISGISTRMSYYLFYAEDDTYLSITLRNSVLDLYDENDTLIEADGCSADYFEPRFIQFFGKLDRIEITIGMNNNNIKRPICPYVFKNSRIFRLKFMNYGQSFLFANKPIFYDIRNPNKSSIDLNISIFFLVLENIYKNTFNRGEIDLVVFSRIKCLEISGTYLNFERDFFVDFKIMFAFALSLEKVGEFFHASTNEWLTSIFVRFKTYASISEMRLNSTDVGNVPILTVKSTYLSPHMDYTYPNEDFCLFKHFPRTKFVFAQIQMRYEVNATYSNSSNTSCLYRFLTQHNYIINLQHSKNGLTTFDGPMFEDALLNECTFDKMLDDCLNLSRFANELHYLKPFWSLNDVVYAMKWVEFFGPVVSFPVFAASAFFLNLLVILVIRSKTNKKEKLFVNKSFRLIEMNSAFNCIECLIYQFRLMDICMGLNSVFCSSFRGTWFQLYFGSIMIYLSEAMKSCSMMTGLLFSLQRYVETSKIENKRLVFFSNTSVHVLLVFVLIYGLVVSVPVVFNIQFSHMNAFAYDWPVIFNLTTDYITNQAVETSFYFLHYIVNDFLVLFLNLVVDCFLVREIKANLRQKAVNKKKMEEEEDNCVPSRLDKKRASVERKANNMIILSVIIYLFCRVPELVSVIFLYVYPQPLLPETSNSECGFYLSCYLVANAIEYLYMLSYNFNLLLYYKFNKYFSQGFRKFFGISKMNRTD